MKLPWGLGLIGLLGLYPAATRAQDWAWARLAGPGPCDEDQVLLVDRAGNSYVNSGYMNSPDQSNYLIKYDPAGQLLWTRQCYGDGMSLDREGNLFVTGNVSSTNVRTFGDPATSANLITVTNPGSGAWMFLVKFDAAGNVLWGQQADSFQMRGQAVATDPAGNVFLTGWMQKTGTFSSQFVVRSPLDSAGGNSADSRAVSLSSSSDLDLLFFYLAKFDRAGHVLWAQKGGGTGLATDAEGNVFVAGRFNGPTPFYGCVVTNLKPGLTNGYAMQTNWSQIVTNLTTTGGSDMFLAKYDSLGRLAWVRPWAKAAGVVSARLTIDPTGNIFASTAVQLSLAAYDYYLTQYDSSGKPAWTLRAEDCVPGLSSSLSRSVWFAPVPDGNVYLAGSFYGTLSLGATVLTARGTLPDVLLAKCSPSGELLWAKQAGGFGCDWVSGLGVDSGGDAWVTANFWNTTDVGGASFTHAGGGILLARLASTLPSIVNQPLSLRTNVGGTATFAVAVTNAPNARFQWRKDGINLVADLRIGGSTSALLTITDVQAGDAANYSVVIVADTGTTISAPAALWLGPLTQFISATMLPNGAFQVDFVGEPGWLYNVEASQDYQNWSRVTNFLCTQGPFHITDWQARQWSNRFYRAVRGP